MGDQSVTWTAAQEAGLAPPVTRSTATCGASKTEPSEAATRVNIEALSFPFFRWLVHAAHDPFMIVQGTQCHDLRNDLLSFALSSGALSSP